MRHYLTLIALFALMGLVGCGRIPATKTLTLADTEDNFFTAPTIILRDSKLLERRGISLAVINYPTGLAAKNAVLAKSADLGVVAVTPIAAGIAQGEDDRLIATYVRS